MIEKLFPNHIPDQIYWYLWYDRLKPLLKEYHQRVTVHYESEWDDILPGDPRYDLENFYRLDKKFIFNYREKSHRNLVIFNIRHPADHVPQTWIPYNYYYTSKRQDSSGFTPEPNCCQIFPCRCTNHMIILKEH